MRFLALATALMFITPATAFAADAPVCPAKPVIQEPWLTWAAPAKAQAGHATDDATPIPLGRALDATLVPVGHVRYAVPPGKPLADKSYGGVFRVNLARPARIGIALSGAAWVDMLDGAAIAPTAAHGHGPDCSGIRKIVWFDLQPGAHIVQLANAPTETIRIMAAELSGQH